MIAQSLRSIRLNGQRSKSTKHLRQTDSAEEDGFCGMKHIEMKTAGRIEISAPVFLFACIYRGKGSVGDDGTH